MDTPVGNLHPEVPNPATARTRITPTEFAPQPSPTAPSPRPLIAGPDGRVTPQPYPLPAPPAPAGLLESATGRAAPSGRPALLRQFRNQAGTAAVADTMDREGAVQAGREKLAATPEAPPEQAAVEPLIARKPLQMEKPLPDRDADEDAYMGEAVKPHKNRVMSTGSGFGSDIPVPDDATLKAEIAKRVSDPEAQKEAFEHLTDPQTWAYDDDLGTTMEIDRRQAGPGVDLGAVMDHLDRSDIVGKSPKAVSPKVTQMGTRGPGMVDQIVDRTKAKQAASKPSLVKPAAAPAPTTRLPDPGDVDGWERLVDEGKAQYNVHTHAYEYTGPIRPKLTR